MARPVVATRVGLLVEEEDSNGFAEAIPFLIDQPDAAVRMGKSAQRRVEALFNWEKHVEAYDALYRAHRRK
jgi:glycosyltransferase involved in cell wall biosynthesis